MSRIGSPRRRPARGFIGVRSVVGEVLMIECGRLPRRRHIPARTRLDVAEKPKALERENRELRQANEILRKASAYFATAELDRRSKP